MKKTLAVFAFLLLIGSMGVKAEIVGVASVIDGDTLDIHGKRIRFFGIDAPESSQLCDLAGEKYQCGQKAALALDEKIAKQTVRCEEKDIDRYKRIVAVCFIDTTNLNAWMISNGHALAYREYSQEFVEMENKAKAARVGIWAGTFQPPWDYRNNQKETEIVSGNCLIKGNINSKGKHIYHMPGSTWYRKTQINVTTGERWFCSEDDARKAGWLKAEAQ
jgi:endonuclease YncB( thermonuclease family)